MLARLLFEKNIRKQKIKSRLIQFVISVLNEEIKTIYFYLFKKSTVHVNTYELDTDRAKNELFYNDGFFVF